MKLLIISDTHGSRHGFDDIIEREAPIDMMLHLGDTEGDNDYLEAVADCPCYFVCGNNDWGTGEPYDRVVRIGNETIFMTHGHGYGLYFGYKDLVKTAKQNQAGTIIHGHTHRPLDMVEDGIRILNPGSVAYPRQSGRKPGYIIGIMDENGKISYEQKYLD